MGNPVPSFSTASAHSRNPHGSRYEGGSRYHSDQIIQGGPGATSPSTMDHTDHEISVAGQLVTPTRRLINPCTVMPTTTLTPILMPTIASRAVGLGDIRWNSNADRNTTNNTVTPSASDHSLPSSQWDPVPLQQGYELYSGP